MQFLHLAPTMFKPGLRIRIRAFSNSGFFWGRMRGVLRGPVYIAGRINIAFFYSQGLIRTWVIFARIRSPGLK